MLKARPGGNQCTRQVYERSRRWITLDSLEKSAEQPPRKIKNSKKSGRPPSRVHRQQKKYSRPSLTTVLYYIHFCVRVFFSRFLILFRALLFFFLRTGRTFTRVHLSDRRSIEVSRDATRSFEIFKKRLLAVYHGKHVKFKCEPAGNIFSPPSRSRSVNRSISIFPRLRNNDGEGVGFSGPLCACNALPGAAGGGQRGNPSFLLSSKRAPRDKSLRNTRSARPSVNRTVALLIRGAASRPPVAFCFTWPPKTTRAHKEESQVKPRSPLRVEPMLSRVLLQVARCQFGNVLFSIRFSGHRVQLECRGRNKYLKKNNNNMEIYENI